MSLSSLIRGKSALARSATLTAATGATLISGDVGNVASVASVSVATHSEPQTEVIANTLTTDDEKAIRAWLALIEENEPAEVAEVLNRCRADPDALAYYIGRAQADLPKIYADPDDRRTCAQCAKLIGKRCKAGVYGRAEISGAISLIPWRCEDCRPVWKFTPWIVAGRN